MQLIRIDTHEEIEHLDGFIRAEIVKRKIPLEVLLAPEGADYILTGNLVIQEKRSWHEGWLSAEKDHKCRQHNDC